MKLNRPGCNVIYLIIIIIFLNRVFIRDPIGVTTYRDGYKDEPKLCLKENYAILSFFFSKMICNLLLSRYSVAE